MIVICYHISTAIDTSGLCSKRSTVPFYQWRYYYNFVRVLVLVGIADVRGRERRKLEIEVLCIFWKGRTFDAWNGIVGFEVSIAGEGRGKGKGVWCKTSERPWMVGMAGDG